MAINELVTTLNKASGLEENQAKTAIFYAMATHKLSSFDWFPVLAFIGAPGTGKSSALDILAQLCYKSYRITCHTTMTPVALRDELEAARNRTAIIEEGDLYSNKKQLQSYLISRVDRLRTSGVAVKEQVESESGLKEWRTRRKQVFGATILHDRNSLDDLAAESRAIIISTVFKEGSYIKPPKNLNSRLPAFKLGNVPDYFEGGRALDTWRPLIMIAAGLDDTEWLSWVYLQIGKQPVNSEMVKPMRRSWLYLVKSLRLITIIAEWVFG